MIDCGGKVAGLPSKKLKVGSEETKVTAVDLTASWKTRRHSQSGPRTWGFTSSAKNARNSACNPAGSGVNSLGSAFARA